jgi:hypothetical protein
MTPLPQGTHPPSNGRPYVIRGRRLPRCPLGRSTLYGFRKGGFELPQMRQLTEDLGEPGNTVASNESGGVAPDPVVRVRPKIAEGRG